MVVFGQACPSQVSISANPGTSICAGTSVTFSANITGGSNYLYQWQLNGGNINGETNAIYTSSSLNNSNQIKLIVKSSDDANCSTASNTLTLTVNPQLSPSLSISASSTNICPGNNITFTPSPLNGGTSPAYKWKVDGVQKGTGSTFSTTILTNNQVVTAEMTSNASCVSTATVQSSNQINIQVSAGTPSSPGTITGNAFVCPGISETYSIGAVPGATEYIWTLPSGWTGTSSTNSITVNSGSNGSGNITVKAKNNCGTSSAQSLSVTVKSGTPSTPGTISGSVNVCPATQETYSIPAVAGAEEYIWNLPSGWSGASSTNSITVTTGSSGIGNISVKAKNSCGTSAEKALAVSVKPGTPSTPGTISGATAVCPNTSQTYSVAGVSGASEYIWTLPSGWSGTSTTNSITVTSGTTGGNISVKAKNDCGTSNAQTLALTVKPSTPAVPGNISGSPTVCPSTSETFSIAAVTGASEYIWTLPAGWTGTSTTNSITVTTGTSGSGNISVQAKNDCGTGSSKSLAVTISKPAPVMTGTITGNSNVCSGNTGLTYTIPAVTDATSYTWTVPSGWTITAGATSNSITATAGASGNISVIAKNSCGDSSSSTNFAVQSTSGVPATPGTITSSLTTNPNVCPPASGITFSVAAVPNATGYNWIMPPGWEITSGANTNSIIAKANANTPFPATQSIKVEATNICGKSGQSAFNGINISNHVDVSIGNDQVICKTTSPVTINASIGFGGKSIRVTNIQSDGTGTFNGTPNSNQKVDNFSFTYTPSANDIANKTEINITLTAEQPNGACTSNLSSDVMKIIFKPDPTASIAGAATICAGNTTDITFTATPNSQVTYKIGTGANQTINIGASGSAILATAALTASTTYTLVSVQNAATPSCSKSLSGSVAITVTQKPTATISYTGNPICKTSTSTPVTLTGTNGYTGGEYSSSTGLSINASTGAINASTSNAGTYTVTYNTPASGGCESISATTQITITPIPTTIITYSNASFCKSISTAQNVNLTGTNAYTGGIFSAPAGLSLNASSGAIIPNTSTPGNYIVTYETPASGGCAKTSTTTNVVITAIPTATISYANSPFCISDVSNKTVTLNGTGAYQNGTYSSTSGLTINASSGEIIPSSSAPGSYTISYKTQDGGGCVGITTTTNVTLTKTPSATISYNGPFCQSDSQIKQVTFTNTIGAYENGTFNGTAGLSINTTTGAINPSLSQSGEHTITYSIPTSGGCPSVSNITTKINITAAPKATISYSGPFCTEDAAPKSVSFSTTDGDYTTGIFSATTGLSISGNGDILPASSTPGEHTVYYTIPAGNGCGEVISETTVSIYQKVTITNQPINVGICSTNSASFEVGASGDNLTYVWKRTNGAAITNATGINTSKLEFSNATSVNAGEYIVEVSGVAPCASVSSNPVTLNVDENIIISDPDANQVFCDQEKADVIFEFIAHANGAPLEFTWLKNGVDLNVSPGKYIVTLTPTGDANNSYSGKLEIINPNPSDNGVYAVRIKGPDYFTCSDATSKTYTLNVNPLPPNPTTAGEIFYCKDETAVALTATGESGATFKWYGSETGSDLITNIIPPTNVPGTISYWVSQTTATCESHRTELKITVKPKPASPTTNQAINFCLNTPVTNPLTATGDTSATINWYNAENATTALVSAPIPNTSTNVVTNYWVSQNLNGCESDRVKVTVTINPLPILTATADQSTICKESSTNLKGTGADSYSWSIKGSGGAEIGTGAIFAVSPLATTTYILKGTNSTGCSSSAEVTVTVEEKSVAGSISGATNVCISSNTGNLTLSGNLGNVVNWEKSLDGTTWTAVSPAITSTIYPYTNLTQNTWFRAEVKNGTSCASIKTEGVKITVDPIPVGGKLTFSGTTVNSYLICYSATGSISKNIILSEQVGTVVRWERSNNAGISWASVGHTGETTFNDFAGITSTTLFRAILTSGTCGTKTSKIAVVNVIPDNIKPSPVKADKSIVCLGENVNLTSESGYASGSYITSGYFNNANPEGWIVDGNSGNNFPANGNNTRPNRWSETNDHPFDTRDGSKVFDSKDKKFAIVSGQNLSTLETPVFNTFGLSTASLKFDEAFIMGANSSMKIELSVDGGSSYTVVLRDKPYGLSADGVYRTNNYSDFSGSNQSIDLSNYVGQANLKVRFTFDGRNDPERSIWAIDGITLPDKPINVDIIWTNEAGVTIGNTENITVTPKKPGVNIFNVTSYIVLDGTGAPCYSSGGNTSSVSVFAYDNYSSTASLVPNQNVVCGSNSVILQGKIFSTYENSEVTAFAAGDNSSAKWTITGLTEAQSDPYFSNPKDPNAVFTAPFSATLYELNWKITADPKSTCTAPSTPIQVSFKECTTIDFDGTDDFVDLGTTYTGNYSLEAWIRPESANGTILSGPGYELSLVANRPTFISGSGSINSSKTIIANTRWYHIAVSDGKMYIDGQETGSGSVTTGGTASPTYIGARYNSTNKKPENYFSGWIEEVRIWNAIISQDQIRFLMNQRLQNNANIGVEIPMPSPGGLTYNNLAGYYQLIIGNISGGTTPDLATNAVPGRMRNMQTFQENTAPLPYTSRVDDQTWFTDDTWTNYPVWDAPNSNGVLGTPIEWNIVKTSHNITSGGKDIIVLGLKSEVANKKLSIQSPGFTGKPEENPGQILEVTHYLKLDGIIDLVGESQLLQGEGSILEEASKGYLEKDQQGTKSSFNYNYWTSIVSPQGGANNSNYNIAGILLNGTDSNNPLPISFVGGPYGADNAAVNTSIYWLWRFHGIANDYASWIYLGSNGMLQTGEAFTMKGTSGTAAISERQNYVFRGKPNNGIIKNLNINGNENYLIGNPYPSAMDANEFLKDNLSSSQVNGARNSKNIFNGALYFWDHFAGSTHVLREYIGGYAVYNLSGGAPAISNDERILDNNATGTKTPKQYIPVGQGFFVNTDLVNPDGPVLPQGGPIVMKNSQRIGVKEGGLSTFLSPEKLKEKLQLDARSKIRITFNSPKGYHRQLLVTADENTTNQFDLGYDAPMIEDNIEDMYWVQGKNMLVIQGVPNFNLDQELPLGIKLKEQGAFSIQIDTLENEPRSEFNVYLLDVLKDSIHNLKEFPYLETAEAGITNDRFKIIFYKEEPPITGTDEVDEDIDEQIDLSVRHGYQLHEIQILNSQLIPISELYLFDLNGKLIQVFKNIETEKEVRLKLKNFSAGVYIIKLISNDRTITRKIIIPK